MTVRYAVIRERHGFDHCSYVSCGLAAYADRTHDENPVAVIHDVTTDLQALTCLTEKCNRLHLSVLHMHDIIEDFLAE